MYCSHRGGYVPNEHRADPTPPPHHGQGRGGSKKEFLLLEGESGLTPARKTLPTSRRHGRSWPWSGDAGILRLNMVLTDGIPPDSRGGVHLYIQSAIHYQVSLEFIGSRRCVSMAFTAKSPPAHSQ